MAAALDTVAPGGRFRPRATVRNVGVAAAACGGCSEGLVVGESMVGSGGRGIGGVFGMFGWLSAALFGMCAWGAVAVHTVPYVPSASSAPHAGVVRIESRSARSGRVRVVAVDDAGQRLEAGVLTLGARAAVQFEVAAMESGDASAGLTGTGPGQGDWRLELSTELDIGARARRDFSRRCTMLCCYRGRSSCRFSTLQATRVGGACCGWRTRARNGCG